MNLRKNARRLFARERLQDLFRLLYRFSLVGMNYGGAASEKSSGDELALGLLEQGKSSPVIFDVGANVGGYVAAALNILEARTPEVYAFEPSRIAFAELERAFAGRTHVHLIRQGIGAVSSTTKLYAAAPGSVLATTYANPLVDAKVVEDIEITTLDGFCAARRIERIDLLKLDLEGGELDALRGARELLGHNAIKMIQFEFGQSSLGARTYFVDLFKLLEDQFDVFRILPQGLAPITTYHETLEVFMATNYLAMARA